MKKDNQTSTNHEQSPVSPLHILLYYCLTSSYFCLAPANYRLAPANYRLAPANHRLVSANYRLAAANNNRLRPKSGCF